MTNPTTSITRERLMNPPVKVEAVMLPDGNTAYLTRIAESDLALYESALYGDDGKVDDAAWKSQRRRLLVLCLCDETGQRLFKPGEAELLATMDGAEAELLNAEYNKRFRAPRPSIKSLGKKSDAADESDSPSESAAS